MASPIPVLVTGRSEQVATTVIEGLKPEYEVIHFTLAASIEQELIPLLSNTPPSTPSSTLGTGNWSSPPRALLLGGAYTDEGIAALRDILAQNPTVSRIPWLRVDTAKTAALAPGPLPQGGPPGPEYGLLVAARAKETLKRLEEEGKLTAENGEVHLL